MKKTKTHMLLIILTLAIAVIIAAFAVADSYYTTDDTTDYNWSSGSFSDTRSDGENVTLDMSTISAGDLLDLDCTSAELVDSWTDDDYGSGASTAETNVPAADVVATAWKFSAPVAPNDDADRVKDVGSIEGLGDRVVVSAKIYNDLVGTRAANDYFRLGVYRNDWQLAVAFASDGLLINDGSSWVEVGTDLVVQDSWQEWTFDINLSSGVANATCDVYLDGDLEESNVDCSVESSPIADGSVRITQDAGTTDNMLSYLDWLKIGNETGYYGIGNYTSQIFDAGSLASWNNLSWQATTPSSTDTAQQDWASWDESSEAGLASDDIFVALFGNTSANGDEVGQGGGLSGADLVLTEFGGVAGATGSPSTRALGTGGSDEYFSMTDNAITSLIANTDNTWTIVLKVTNFENNNQILWLGNNVNPWAEEIRLYRDASSKLGSIVRQDASQDSIVTTNVMAATTTYYIVLWTDGTDLRAGFSTTKPTKWSDFAVNNRAIFPTLTGAYAGESMAGVQNIFNYDSPSLGIDCDAYYVIISKENLIENDDDYSTDIDLQTKISNDNVDWTPWSSNHANPSGLINSSARYLQYKATLTTSDTSYTPYLQWVNVSYLLLSNPPDTTNFTSTETTNFSAEENLTNVTNLTLAIPNKGKINFPESTEINAENEDYDTHIKIEDSVISVNTSALDQTFNSSATLTFENVDCNYPYVYYSATAITRVAILTEDTLCPSSICSNIQCTDSTLTVDVAHFSGYAVNGTANLTIDADDPKYPLELVTFTAEYRNATGLIEGATCTISLPDGNHAMNKLASNIYNYSTKFALAQTVDYNVTCSAAGENTVFASDTAMIVDLDIPEFSIITLGLGLIVVLAGLFVMRKRK